MPGPPRQFRQVAGPDIAYDLASPCGLWQVDRLELLVRGKPFGSELASDSALLDPSERQTWVRNVAI